MSAEGRGAAGGVDGKRNRSKSAYTPQPEPTPIYSESGLILDVAGGDQSGSTNLARVHRAQWNDYLKRFAPIEDMLFDRLLDPNHKAESVEKAGLTMGGSFDRSKDQMDRSVSRLGLNMTPTQTARRDKEFELEKTAAIAGAKNATRVAKDDQDMGIMAGGISSLAQQRA